MSNFDTTKTLRIFSKRTKKLRNKRGLSQEELAKEIGVDRDVILNCEKENKPSFDTLIGLLHFLKVSPNYLLGKSDKYKLTNRALLTAKLMSKLNKKEQKAILNIVSVKVSMIEHENNVAYISKGKINPNYNTEEKTAEVY